jgi:signal transduction histidine kinase
MSDAQAHESAPESPPDTSFGLLKFVTWSTLVLILVTSLFLSIFLGNHARQMLLDRQNDFAQFQTSSLSSIIIKRFYIPTHYAFGFVDLNMQEQYKWLDEVIRAGIENSPASDIRLYDLDGRVIYAQDRSLLGRADLGGETVRKAMDQEKPFYEFIYQTSTLGALFSAEIAPNAVVMRAVAPIRFKGKLPMPIPPPGFELEPGGGAGAEAGPGGLPPAARESGRRDGEAPAPDPRQRPALPGQEGQPPLPVGGELVEVEGVIGGMEFAIDITADYKKLVAFQRITILAAVATSLIIFFVLRTLIHRADRINAQRLREREEFERKALQDEKLVSMGRMVAGIAHEIRNPLGIIRSSSELLVSRLKDKDPLTAKILTAINEEAVRLSKTVGDFLDYARPRELKLDPVDLSLLLDQALTFLEQKCAQQGVQVVRDYEPGVTVMADKDLLYRALYNILVNAMEAMAGQEAAEEEGGVRGQIVVRASQADKGAYLSILDTGPGVPPDIRDNLLDPFFTTKQNGTGLGLAITASILQSHGAHIEIGDNPEGGARVDIAFAKP